MSSHTKLINPSTVHWTCFLLQWVFMIATIFAAIDWINTLSMISFVTLIAFIHYTLRFHTLPKIYLKDPFKDYNSEVERINALPRIIRRKIIRKYYSKGIK